ncbi:2-amino-4-hydroxy-6-hydroxymethyldihydropteridine diphosphokinase [Bhargavaea beijingensis]|uniref:2-amino-4-hydroxy-6-hydroxymethyldihydropteridine diphosphokinase n=1 Tax=Bhargavaea beijingensis TaxID=426756 RepID=A0ABX9ZB30_9BACL|nr:2-amino-4-hydroxy-6-hydroxymethyldihydropteridine diphosphokinase [Bhargavaea beijingensis]MCW1929455.1 2-amino-4-hydroxy-6-hydroxymethyldihydropteridine diphosphokinase [Bhargavaea beijingensis]RSK24899.1 2-amino-4-hydroxy-6-hydroxymethyldihydropteridine diphosphokinase [Bhargavaea beijingensis]
MNIAYLSAGSNMGNREAYLREAAIRLNSLPGTELDRLSSIYETDPVGYEDQAAFLNMVFRLRTTLGAEALLDACLGIEAEIGRVRTVRWGPRVCDLDILLFNDDTVKTEKLTVPHPRMHERAFVLVPLLEVDPGLSESLKKRFPGFPGVDLKDGIRVYKSVKGPAAFLEGK